MRLRDYPHVARQYRTQLLHSVHLNFPLRHVDASGPSCRLAFANAVIAAMVSGAGFTPDRTALLGDITLNGRVLPVGHTARKAEAAQQAGLPGLVVPVDYADGSAGALTIASLDEIPGVRP
jgi:ATP-dependent Lon protease